MQSNPSSSFASAPSWAQSQQGPPIDPFQRTTQSYQSGYLMSTVQGNPMPSNNQRFDNPALLPTKAKAHHLAHSTSDDYGSDSLFDRPKARHAMDEDAPPVNSVADIISQAQPDPFARKVGSNTDSPRRLGLSSSSRAMVPSLHSLSHSHSQSLSIQRQPEVTFVLVFGFPPEQYSSVASTFASADASPPERASDTTNWFKIGYRSTWDAQRALRRNGEVVDGLFMIGVVAVDAEMDVSAPVPRPASGDLASPGLGRSQTFTTFGTPIALAPSHSAFRPPSAAPSGGAKPASTSPVFAAPETGQSGGWTSKISDAIFGW